MPNHSIDGVYRVRSGRMMHWRAAGFVALALVLAGCGASTNTSATSTSTPTTTVAPSPTATPSGYPLQVFLSKSPESDNNALTFPVKRIAPTPRVEVFAIQLLIAGPTPEERAAGYFTELNSILNGPSTCSAAPAPTGGPDFTLTLDHKGSTPETGTATLRFCRATLSPGVGTDARILAQINATLLQFPTIKKVVVLTLAGRCFGDLSGMDRCLS